MIVAVGAAGRSGRVAFPVTVTSQTQRLADSAGLHAVNTTTNPAWANPTKFGPLGTDHLGRSVMTQRTSRSSPR